MNTRATLCVATLIFSNAAFADAPAAVPKHTCMKPELLGIEPSNTQIKSFNKAVDTYRLCMKAYQEDRKAALKELEIAVKANLEAFNNATDEFNAFVASMQASQDK